MRPCPFVFPLRGGTMLALLAACLIALPQGARAGTILPDTLLAPALEALGLEPAELTCFPEFNRRDPFRLPLIDSLMTSPARSDRILPPLLSGLVGSAAADSLGGPDLSPLTRAHAWLFDVGASPPPLPWESAREKLLRMRSGRLAAPAPFFRELMRVVLAERDSALAKLTPSELAWLTLQSPHLLDELEDADEIRDPLTLRHMEQESTERGDSTLALWTRVDRPLLYRAGFRFIRDAHGYGRLLASGPYASAERGAEDSAVSHVFPDGSRASGALLYAESTEHGNLAIGAAGENRYEGRFLFVLDLGGDDFYHLGSAWPAATGGDALAAGGFRCLIDLDGADRYEAQASGALAGAFLGAALLTDDAGDDVYRAHSFDLGCGWLGLGVLADMAGDDYYAGDSAVLGAGGAGLGLLLDASGSDIYRANAYAQGFGYVGGLGLLSDMDGNDVYAAVPKYTDILRYEDHSITLSQGFAIGARPNYSGGIGILSDRAGNDSYLADIYGQGSAYWYGLGRLWDQAGNDRYDAYQYAQGAGIHLAVGLLLDDGGNDSYSVHGVGQGCGHDLAFGLLRDAGGNDRYSCDDLSQGAGSANGIGLLVDAAGLDGYLGKSHSAPAYGNPRRHYGSVGILVDGSGTDWVSRRATPGERRASLRGLLLDRDVALAGPVWDPGPAIPYADSSYSWDDWFLMASSGEPRFREWQQAGTDSLVAHPAEAIAALIPHFDTDVARQRHRIKDVMKTIGEEAVGPLRAVLREGPESYWGEAVWCLQEIRDARAFPELMALLAEPRGFRDQTAALAALSRLEGLGDTELDFLAETCARLAADTGTHPLVLKEIAYLCGELDIGSAELLLDLSMREHYAPRWMAAGALAERKGWGRALARAWRGATPAGRRQLCALLPLRSPRECVALVRLARRDGGWREPVLRRTVLRALVEHPEREGRILGRLFADLVAEFPAQRPAGIE